MGIEKEDLRAVRTEKALLDAFHKLALQKDLGEISVRELTDLAGINRKTFYLHYHNIDEFVLQLQQEFVKEVAEYMGDILKTKDGRAAFSRTLCYLAEDPHWSYLICTRFDYGQIWNVIVDPGQRPWVFEDFLENRSPVLAAYLLGSLRNVFCLWYENGMTTRKEVMAERATRLVYDGVATLEREPLIF